MSESHSVTCINVYNVEYCLIKTDSMLSLSNKDCNIFKSLGYLHINII